MTGKVRLFFCGILVFVCVFYFIGCNPSKTQKDQVTLQLNFTNSTEFIGYYVAQDKGFYRGANLDVTIKEGGTGIPAWQTIFSNSANFAIDTFDEQKQNVVNNRHSVAVMTTFQIPPLVMFSLADSGIKEPKDIVGKRVGITNSYWSNIASTTLSNAGVDPSTMIQVPVSPDTLSMLYDHEVDVWMGYANDEPIQAEEAGYEINEIFPADYGVGGYEGLLTVNQSTINENPDMVKRFVSASQKGLQYAMQHPDEAAEIMSKWQPDESLDFYAKSIRALIPLVDIPQSKIGTIDAVRWAQLMGSSNNVQNPGYTMKFLQGN